MVGGLGCDEWSPASPAGLGAADALWHGGVGWDAADALWHGGVGWDAVDALWHGRVASVRAVGRSIAEDERRVSTEAVQDEAFCYTPCFKSRSAAARQRLAGRAPADSRGWICEEPPER